MRIVYLIRIPGVVRTSYTCYQKMGKFMLCSFSTINHLYNEVLHMVKFVCGFESMVITYLCLWWDLDCTFIISACDSDVVFLRFCLRITSIKYDFEVLATVSMKMAVFWVAPCRLL
jgi:hypothetical protein